jgi:hypothetical protein
VTVIEGEHWCQWDAGCRASMVTPQEISPAGTFVGGAPVRLAGRGLDVVPCNGFIVAHLSALAPRSQELRI